MKAYKIPQLKFKIKIKKRPQKLHLQTIHNNGPINTVVILSNIIKAQGYIVGGKKYVQ